VFWRTNDYKTKAQVSTADETQERPVEFELTTLKGPNGMPYGSFYARSDGVVIFANDAVKDLPGYEPVESPGQTTNAFLGDGGNIREVFRTEKETLAGRISKIWEITCKEKNGDRVIGKISAGTLRIDRRTHVVITYDGTEGQRAADKALSEKSRRLAEAHTALGVLLERYHEDRAQLREGVVLNVRETIVPYLEKLRGTQLNQTQTEYIDIIQKGLADIVSPFAARISSRTLNLTPREIEIAYLIREGKTTKQIAQFMNLSPRCVDTHRYNLRRKLGIGAKKINLRSHILSVADIEDFGSCPPARVFVPTHGPRDSRKLRKVFGGGLNATINN